MVKSSAKIGYACFIGLLALSFVTLIYYNLMSPLLATPVSRIVGRLFTYFNLISFFGSMLLAVLVYAKMVAKSKFNVLAALVSAAAYTVLLWLVTRILGRVPITGAGRTIITSFVRFLFGAITGFIYLLIAKPAVQVAAPVAQSAYVEVNRADPRAETSTAYTASTQAAPEDMDRLCAAILNAIRPQLKAPLTAVLCGREQMIITNNNGVYEVRGIVNSQNSYGALIATDFSVKASYINGSWVISSVSVGKQAAKNYAKNFAANYIIISIFVAVMGALGYFILKMVFRF